MEKLFLIPFEERKNCHLKGFIHKTEKSKHKKFLQIWAQMPNVKNSWWKPSQIENFNKSKSKCIEEVKPFDINENGTWFVCFWNGFPLYLIPKIAQITAEWNHFGGIFVFFNQHDFRWNREVLNAEKWRNLSKTDSYEIWTETQLLIMLAQWFRKKNPIVILSKYFLLQLHKIHNKFR